jgi:hypothetical protein
MTATVDVVLHHIILNWHCVWRLSNPAFAQASDHAVWLFLVLPYFVALFRL